MNSGCIIREQEGNKGLYRELQLAMVIDVNRNKEHKEIYPGRLKVDWCWAACVRKWNRRSVWDFLWTSVSGFKRSEFISVLPWEFILALGGGR